MTKNQLHELKLLIEENAQFHRKLSIFCSRCEFENEATSKKHHYEVLPGDKVTYALCFPQTLKKEKDEPSFEDTSEPATTKNERENTIPRLISFNNKESTDL